jgi:hypothetical protein
MHLGGIEAFAVGQTEHGPRMRHCQRLACGLRSRPRIARQCRRPAGRHRPNASFLALPRPHAAGHFQPLVMVGFPTGRLEEVRGLSRRRPHWPSRCGPRVLKDTPSTSASRGHRGRVPRPTQALPASCRILTTVAASTLPCCVQLEPEFNATCRSKAPIEYIAELLALMADEFIAAPTTATSGRIGSSRSWHGLCATTWSIRPGLSRGRVCDPDLPREWSTSQSP